MTTKADILIIDDHAVVRAGCELLLRHFEDARIFQASTGEEGLQLNLERKPGLVVLDIGLKDASGLDLLKRIRADNPAGQVLIFTMYDDPVMALRAMEEEASGYVTKSEAPHVFLAAAEKVLEGDIYLSHAIAQKIALLNIRSGAHPLRDLTVREIDVLRLLGEGKSLAQIADALNIGYRTVANTVSLIKRKLNAPTTGRLLYLAMEYIKAKP